MKITKTFVSDIKSVNEDDFTVEAVISDETVDRYREVINIDAWSKRLKRYKAHPVLLSSHNYNKLTNQIGHAEKIFIDDKQLIAKFKYYVNEGNSEADWGWKLASKFKKAAFSVGFLSYDYERKEVDEEDYKTGKKPERIYTDVELIEVSQVLVPANPSAQQLKGLEDDDENDLSVKEYFNMVTKAIEDKEIEDDLITKPDTTNYVHIPAPGQEGKHKGHKIRTIPISAKEGIQAHYCIQDKIITGYLFDKSKGWDHETAAKWVADHAKKYFILEDGENIIIEEVEKVDKILEAIKELSDKVEAMSQKMEEERQKKIVDEEAEKKRLEDEQVEMEANLKKNEENYLQQVLSDIRKIADSVQSILKVD